MKKKRLLAILLSLCMMIGLLPVTALAAEEGTQENPWNISAEGEGNNVTAYLTQNSDSSTYTLTISGSGAMEEFANPKVVPWASNKGKITQIVLSEGLTNIGGYAFFQTKAESITIPSTVTSIGPCVFHTIDPTSGNPVVINVPASVQMMGATAFFGKFEANIDGENPYFYTTNDGKFIYRRAENGATHALVYTSQDYATNALTFEDGITELGDSSIRGCTQISGTVTIPDGVKRIGQNALLGTNSIAGITIPNSVSFIGNSAFSDSDGKSMAANTTLNLNGDNDVFIGQNVFRFGKLTSVNISAKDSITLGQEAFSNNANLETVVLEAENIAIGHQAFNNCNSYHSMVILGNISFPEGTRMQFKKDHGTTVPVIYVKDQANRNVIDESRYNDHYLSIPIFAITNGGTFAENAGFEAGKLATPEKSGYKFAGWYDNADCTGTAVTDTVVGQTYYAKWKPVIAVTGNADKTYDGQDVTLSVPAVDGATYTWKKDGVEVSGANSRTLALKNVADSGSYTCTITAGGASETSDPVAVSITKADPALTLSATSGSCRINKGPVTFTYTYDGDGTVSVSSSDTNVATASIDGNTVTVELKSVGTATITVSAAEGENYDAAQDATYTLTVLKKASGSSSDSSSSGGGSASVKPEEKPAEPDVKPEEKPAEKPAEPTIPTNPAEVPDTEKIVLTVGQRVTNAFGSPVVNDVAPIIREDRTMLPIRFIAEGLGATVAWDDALNKVSITKGDDVIDIYIGSVVAFVNGSPVELDSPAFIETSRTYLPLRFVAENLGATVFWNAETQEVTIVPINEA